MSENCWLLSVFFFQAEDGIRDIGVTGVQTCALPILNTIITKNCAHLLAFSLTNKMIYGLWGVESNHKKLKPK